MAIRPQKGKDIQIMVKILISPIIVYLMLTDVDYNHRLRPLSGNARHILKERYPTKFGMMIFTRETPVNPPQQQNDYVEHKFKKTRF